MGNISITQIAERLNLSPSTVSRALNEKYGVKPETRRRVIALAKELGYVPNLGARELVSGSSKLISIIVPEAGPAARPPLFEIIPDINQVLSGHSYETLVRFFNRASYQPGDFVAFCRRRNIEGAVILPGFGATHLIWEEAAASDIPCVVLAEDVIGPHCSNLATDETSGFTAIVSHLAAAGHHHIGFVNGPASITICAWRLKGYQMGLSEAGLDYREAYVIHSDFSAAGGAAAASELMNRCPDITALCFANDMMAIGAISRFASKQIRVPHHLSIVGCDDIYPAAYITPPLTTLHHSMQMGFRSAELLLQMMEGARGTSERLEPTLVVRESVASPRA